MQVCYLWVCFIYSTIIFPKLTLCRQGFCIAYNMSLSYLDRLCRAIKAGHCFSDDADNNRLSTVATMKCVTWMKNHFDLVGDKQPNAEEIHLDPITK
jgi:hypothetical protein